ncbi:hypothetical protein E2C01_070262 [Portunus trituberculatus]|uniref:Uncharacterized protein n=1 Tax=Portunus trituberculatus TaxID=210409 RepID=A0A5B7I147_PORTR|nr:hypothetical protein [Portunus trituberculatus]
METSGKSQSVNGGKRYAESSEGGRTGEAGERLASEGEGWTKQVTRKRVLHPTLGDPLEKMKCCSGPLTLETARSPRPLTLIWQKLKVDGHSSVAVSHNKDEDVRGADGEVEYWVTSVISFTGLQGCRSHCVEDAVRRSGHGPYKFHSFI